MDNCTYEKSCKVISDDNISIVCNSDFINNISPNKVMFFDIVLNEDNSIIGDISFYFSASNELEYGGNITYNIEPEYRNKHYATRALKLFKKIIKDVKYEGNKDIYISTVPYDTATQTVAKNNDAYLYFQGRVPENDSLCYLNGIKLVKIYRIQL